MIGVPTPWVPRDVGVSYDHSGDWSCGDHIWPHDFALTLIATTYYYHAAVYIYLVECIDTSFFSFSFFSW